MKNYSYKIHNFVTSGRLNEDNQTIDYKNLKNTPPNPPKTYERMPKILLPKPIEVDVTLQESIFNRRSTRGNSKKSLSVEDLSAILHTLSCNKEGLRGYPSGGAKYPIEAYVLAQDVKELAKNVYHYNPKSHSLENLWEIPSETKIFTQINDWANTARAIIVFTGNWQKSGDKYGSYSYLLGVLECGHAAQNILLTASSLEVNACALAGIKDMVLYDLLDIDASTEQFIYSIALG